MSGKSLRILLFKLDLPIEFHIQFHSRDFQRHSGREGLGAGQIADEIIADEEAAIPGISVERTGLTVGGEDAVVLEVDGWRIRLFCENIPEIVISMKNRILKTPRGAWIIGFHSLIGVRLAGIEQFIL